MLRRVTFSLLIRRISPELFPPVQSEVTLSGPKAPRFSLVQWAPHRNDFGNAGLGNECPPNRCSRPSVRAVNRWNLLPVQLICDLFKRHPLPEHRVDPCPPFVVTSIAEPMPEPDIVGREVTSVHLESRIVVGRWLPIRTRPSRLEVPTAPEAVAMGHLATHIDYLPIAGKLPEDSAHPPCLELLNRRFSSVRRWRCRSCLSDLLFVVHARALISRRWRQSCSAAEALPPQSD